jgi:hypothetical protein
MAEQKDTNNAGVGTLNTGNSGINDGTLSVDSNSGAGGGGGNSTTASLGTGSTSGSSGSSGNSSSSTSTPPNQNVEYLKNSIDAYLGTSIMGYAFEDIISVYVDKKLGFETAEQEYLENNKDLTPDEVQDVKKAMKEEKEAAIETFKSGTSKDELKKKFNEFKSSAFEVGKAVKSVPTEFVKVISESIMPNVIGPVGPNPFSSVLKAYNGIARLKRSIDTIFISTQVLITSAEAIGIDKTPQFNAFISPFANGLRTLQTTIGNIKNKEEEDASDVAMQAKIEEAKKSWNYRFAGKTWTADSVEEMARGPLFKIFVFPITNDNRRDLENAVKKIGSSDAAKRQKAKWAHVILKYNDWLNWFKNEINKQQNNNTTTPQGSEGPSD